MILGRFRSLPRSLLAVYALALTLFIGIADYLTGFEVGMDLFYLFPIAFATWYLGTGTGTVFAFLTVITATLSDMLSGKVYLHVGVELWNTTLRLAFYLVVVVLLARLHSIMRERAKLIGELQDTLKEVKELRGILPICASCKKIRNDEGYWQNVEEYISHHTNAEFSHGICEDCARKLYPHLFHDKKKSGTS